MIKDVVVIGGGLAGGVAAWSAANEKVEVVQIRKGFGATGMSSGIMDVLGEYKLENDPLFRLQNLIHSRPDHPYTLIENSAEGILSVIKSTLEEAKNIFNPERLSLEISINNPMLLPTLFGNLRKGDVCWASARKLNFQKARDIHVLCVGIEGLSVFHPEFLASALKQKVSEYLPTALEKADFIWIKMDFLGDYNIQFFEAAKKMDTPTGLEIFLEQIRKTIKPVKYSHLLLPPILGLENYPSNIARIEQETGLLVAELLTPPPSVHGYRLQRELDAGLKRMNIASVNGEVIGFKADEGKIREVKVRTGNREWDVEGAQFILATGRFSTGGIFVDRNISESIFHLPIFLDGKILSEVIAENFLKPSFFEEQPLFRAGIKVNSEFQPLNQFQEVAFQNLRACGAVIGGYDPCADRCGLGVALVSGFLVGKLAALASKSG